MSDPQHSIEIGTKFPYHDRKPNDQAEVAVLGILANLCDRRGIKHGFEDVDKDTRVEIVESLSEIVRTAFKVDFERTYTLTEAIELVKKGKQVFHPEFRGYGKSELRVYHVGAPQEYLNLSTIEGVEYLSIWPTDGYTLN